MDKNTVIEAVRFFVEELTRGGLTVDRAVLFGSHARNEGRSDSDIDLAIISADFVGKDIFERAKCIGDAERLTIRRFDVPLDIVLLTPKETTESDSIVAQFVKEGDPVLLKPVYSLEK